MNNLEKVTKRVLDRYGDKLPRFTIMGMNQVEFIVHLITIGYNVAKKEYEK